MYLDYRPNISANFLGKPEKYLRNMLLHVQCSESVTGKTLRNRLNTFVSHTFIIIIISHQFLTVNKDVCRQFNQQHQMHAKCTKQLKFPESFPFWSPQHVTLHHLSNMSHTSVICPSQWPRSLKCIYGLGTLEHWDCGLESGSRHGCMAAFFCVAVSWVGGDPAMDGTPSTGSYQNV